MSLADIWSEIITILSIKRIQKKNKHSKWKTCWVKSINERHCPALLPGSPMETWSELPSGGKANAEQKLATKAKNQSKGAGIWVSHLSHSGIQVKLSKAVWDFQRSSPGLSVLQKKAY